MATLDPDSVPTDPTIELTAVSPPGALGSSRGQGWLLVLGVALVAGLLAGVVGWFMGEAMLDAYKADLTPRIQRGEAREAGRRYARALVTTSSGTFTVLGAALGLSLGLAGGLARRSAAAAALAGLLGGAVGSIAGVSTSLLILPNFYKNHDPQSEDLVGPMLILGSICSSIGAAGGLAFGIGLGGKGRWLKSLVGGLVGAALATVVYELVGAIAFPEGKTDLPISNTNVTRAMLHILVAALAAVGSALALGLSSRKSDAASPAS